MTNTFSHPLARRAGVDGGDRKVLVIVTPLELDKKRGRYNASLVAKLSEAAEDYIRKAKTLDSFMLIDRPRDWRMSSAS